MPDNFETEIARLKAEIEEMDTRFREICDRGNNNRMRADKAEQRVAVQENAIAALREALRECADDLEAEIQARFPDAIRHHLDRDYESNMVTVNNARATLLGDAIDESILGASDAEVSEELASLGIDPEKVAAEMDAIAQEAKRLAGKSRLARAKDAVSDFRSNPPNASQGDRTALRSRL
jgi:hypothetical protein